MNRLKRLYSKLQQIITNVYFLSYKRSHLFRTEPTKSNNPPSEKPPNPLDSVVLSNPTTPSNDGSSLVEVESGEADIDVNEEETAKKRGKQSKESAHVHTIQPDVNIPHGPRIPNSYEKKRMRISISDLRSAK